tara:strand:+ start:3461 stop:4540 length:1080 start_codon:yes stop_codon:yes gene_type:complete
MPGLPHPFFGSPPAYLGFIGFVRFQQAPINSELPTDAKTMPSAVIRATSADIALSQEITRPDVIDSRYDRTLYQLGPQLVEGNVSFPATYDIGSTTALTGSNVALVEGLYRLAVSRTPGAGLLNPIDIDIKYAENSLSNEAGFIYDQCILNTWQFSVTQSELVNISIDVVGVTRELATEAQLTPPGTDVLQNTRIVTWNDARVEVREGSRGGFGTISGEFIRSFEANINNNVNRYYTLNGRLFPQAIAPTKRDVSGSMVLIGRHKDLGGLAVSNENFCAEDTQVAFGFATNVTNADPDRDCAAGFGVTMPNVVFEIETIGLTNDLFESTVNWHALLASGTGTGEQDIMLSTLDTTVFSF